MDEKVYFTKQGLEKLRKEIGELTKKLEEIQAQSAYVAEVGGNQYHDNSSYEMLVIDLRGIDWLLTDAHHCLNQAVVIHPTAEADKVAIGTRVRIMRDDEESTWEIAGFGESDPERKILAYNTPLASLLVGKREGEVVVGTIAGKRTEIEILEISKGGANEHSG